MAPTPGRIPSKKTRSSAGRDQLSRRCWREGRTLRSAGGSADFVSALSAQRVCTKAPRWEIGGSDRGGDRSASMLSLSASRSCPLNRGCRNAKSPACSRSRLPYRGMFSSRGVPAISRASCLATASPALGGFRAFRAIQIVHEAMYDVPEFRRRVTQERSRVGGAVSDSPVARQDVRCVSHHAERLQ
jgi:hypothetical protein